MYTYCPTLFSISRPTRSTYILNFNALRAIVPRLTNAVPLIPSRLVIDCVDAIVIWVPSHSADLLLLFGLNQHPGPAMQVGMSLLPVLSYVQAQQSHDHRQEREPRDLGRRAVNPRGHRTRRCSCGHHHRRRYRRRPEWRRPRHARSL